MIDPFLVADNNFLYNDFDWYYDDANDLGIETSSTLSSELSINPSEPAAEGKDPKTILSQNLFSGIFYTKNQFFYIDVYAIFIQYNDMQSLSTVVSCRTNPCRHGKHGARFDQKTSLLDVYFLLSNGRIFLPNTLNPDMLSFGGKRGSY
jgi:hypothetical protein